MTRLVYAVDVTATMISIARVTETEDGNPVPELAMVPVPPASTFTPLATWKRASTMADKAMEKISSRGQRPDLVVIAKQLWKEPKTDSSAQRRMAIQALLEDRLHRAGVPVAEVPYATALSWMSGHTPRDKRGILGHLEDVVNETWGLETPTFTTPGDQEKRYPYRLGVVALAAMGTMALGVDTAVPVSTERLAMLTSARNQAMQWPPEFKPPSTITEWHTRHEAGAPARAAG